MGLCESDGLIVIQCAASPDHSIDDVSSVMSQSTKLSDVVERTRPQAETPEEMERSKRILQITQAFESCMQRMKTIQVATGSAPLDGDFQQQIDAMGGAISQAYPKTPKELFKALHKLRKHITPNRTLSSRPCPCA